MTENPGDVKELPAIPAAGSPSEPLAMVGFVSGLVTSVLALLVAFNVNLSDAQGKAILGTVPFVVGAAVWLWGRRRVFSPQTVHRMFAQVAVNRQAVGDTSHQWQWNTGNGTNTSASGTAIATSFRTEELR